MNSHMTEMLENSVYCPSQKACPLTVPGAAKLTAVIKGPGYQSLYDKDRMDLDKLPLRRETFVFFPSWSPVDKNDVAKAGFYYTGEDDTVKCYCCGLTVSHWERTDKPLEVHKMRSPQCQFILRDPSSRWSGVSNDSSDESEDECTDGPSTSRQLTLTDVESTSESSDSEDEMDGSFSQLCRSVEKQSKRSGANDITQMRRPKTQNAICKTVSKANAIDKNALRLENERMKSAFVCRNCRKEKVQTLFLPCRHLVTCEACAEKMDDCLICKQTILGTVKTFLI